jgi:hypothetical protein
LPADLPALQIRLAFAACLILVCAHAPENTMR